MKIAVLNSGSSSLKYKLYEMPAGRVLESKIVEHIGEENSPIQTHEEALAHLAIDYNTLDAIGHRVVHGGEKFSCATLVDASILAQLECLTPLAPLHNPANIQGIRVAQENASDLAQIAVFDTAFHATMPKEAFLYALPLEMYEKYHIRRYGFHGSSHAFVTQEAAKLLHKDVDKINLITLHLGNGASACAVKNGKSIDTSMGFTPLEGLVMGSRSGDIDPAIVLYMQRELKLSIDEVDTLLNKKSGLVGLCQTNDVRNILQNRDEESMLALKIMIRRLQKYIGAYMALLGRVDAVIFTGGIGENSEYIRDAVMQSEMFVDLNAIVIQTNEELYIANEVVGFLKEKDLQAKPVN